MNTLGCGACRGLGLVAILDGAIRVADVEDVAFITQPCYRSRSDKNVSNITVHLSIEKSPMNLPVDVMKIHTSEAPFTKLRSCSVTQFKEYYLSNHRGIASQPHPMSTGLSYSRRAKSRITQTPLVGVVESGGLYNLHYGGEKGHQAVTGGGDVGCRAGVAADPRPCPKRDRTGLRPHL